MPKFIPNAFIPYIAMWFGTFLLTIKCGFCSSKIPAYILRRLCVVLFPQFLDTNDKTNVIPSPVIISWEKCNLNLESQCSFIFLLYKFKIPLFFQYLFRKNHILYVVPCTLRSWIKHSLVINNSLLESSSHLINV